MCVYVCINYVCVHAKLLQSYPTLCDPMDFSPPASTVHGILQARILEWVTMPSPGNLPNPGIKPMPPVVDAPSLNNWTAGKSLYSSFGTIL